MSLDRAADERRVLAECWKALCDSDGLRSTIVVEDDSRGHLDVIVSWPGATLDRANEAAREFARKIKDAFDDSILAAAETLSGVIQAPDRAGHHMLLATSQQQFRDLVQDGALRGLRADQVGLVEQFQPYSVDSHEAPSAQLIRPMMRHLAHMVSPERNPEQPRVAVWAHSASPQIDVGTHGLLHECVSTGDGLLESVRTVARFVYDNARPPQISGNPNVAFDLIFNDEPYPADPDDNLMARSATLIAMAHEFVRAMKRSLQDRPPPRLTPRYRSSVALQTVGSPWGRLATESSAHEDEVAAALAESELGLAMYYDPEGNMTMLLRRGDVTYGRPIPPALPLDPGLQQGIAAEDASLAAASIWGLPDFVMRPRAIDKGSGRREVGDGTIITGDRGLAVQVKSRQANSGDPSRETNWVLKKAAEGARQARGTVRTLCAGSVDLVNVRGRTVRCAGAEIDWVGVVILDHPAPPEVVVESTTGNEPKIVVLLRRDWDFLFDQLRSVSAVVDYVHRVAADEPRPLGDEAIRYYELAQADEDASARPPAAWATKLGATAAAHPILPKVPASSVDTTGHTVFRVILEDIALTEIDRDETDRLATLSLIDRFSVGERAELGRLLLTRLDDVMKAPSGSTKWHFRRVIQDDGTLQLAFGVCSQFSELHREAFNQWAMLRHHEFTTAGLAQVTDTQRTVAVLLTPRHDGRRPWDTTTISIHGELAFTSDELASMQSLWSNRPDAP